MTWSTLLLHPTRYTHYLLLQCWTIIKEGGSQRVKLREFERERGEATVHQVLRSPIRLDGSLGFTPIQERSFVYR
jgi:hypothetical protein